MTTIISRLFPDPKSAHKAADRLMFKGVPRGSIFLVADGDVTGRLERAEVDPKAIAAYARGVAKGNAVLVVKATYKPLGAARVTREVLDGFDTVKVSGASEENDLPWKADHAPSVLKDHPRFFTAAPTLLPHGPLSANFGMRMTKPHRTKRPLTNRRVSRAFWPMPLLSKKRKRSSVISGGRQMSKGFWPMPLLSTKPRRNSAMPGGGLPFSRLFGLRTIQ